MTTPTGPLSSDRVGVVVVAAGSGTRLGAGGPKAFVPLGGRPLLGYALDTVAQIPHLAGVAIVVPATHRDAHHPSWTGIDLPEQAHVVPGGDERSDSVLAGLRVLPECDVVLVHDAARALTPLSVFTAVLKALAAGAAGAVPGLAVIDTIKVVDEQGLITATPERSSLRAVQTPQGFRAKVLHAAYQSGLQATDDAALVELTGHPVRVVAGDPHAFKVTTREDLIAAQRLLAQGWKP